MTKKDLEGMTFHIDLRFPIEVDADWIREKMGDRISDNYEFTEAQLEEFIMNTCLPDYDDFISNLEVLIDYE